MSRRKVIPFPADEAAPLRRLLGMIEAAQEEYGIREPSAEALERAGFVTGPKPPPDPFLGRRILNHVLEREARRVARRLRDSRP